MPKFAITSRLGWPLVVVVCALPVLRWATMLPLGQRFDGLVGSLLSLAQMAGLVGLSLFACNLILATRLRIFEDLFGGLNKVFIAHHVIGGVAFILLLMHPLLMAGRLIPVSVRDAALLLLPTSANVPGVNYGIFALLSLILLLVLTFYFQDHMPYRLWLLTHKFLGAVFLLAGLHVLLTPNDLSSDRMLQGYMLGLLMVGLFAYIYRTFLPNVFMRRYEYVVAGGVQKAAGVVEVQLRPVRQALKYEAGQFLFISFQSGISREWHPFTISSPPKNGEVSITVKSLGKYTGALVELLPRLVGIRARLEGAYGRFPYRNFGNTRQIWIAGGIGVTPFLSMARALGDGPYAIDLYYAVRTESELVDLDQLLAAQSDGANKHFRVIPFVADKQGFLTADYIRQTSGDLAACDVLLCGPPPMMKALKAQLRAAGVPKRRIHSEEFELT